MKILSALDYVDLCARHPGFEHPLDYELRGIGIRETALSDVEDRRGGLDGYLPLPHCTVCGKCHWRDCQKTH